MTRRRGVLIPQRLRILAGSLLNYRVLFCAMLVVWLVGCGEKSLKKDDGRAITSEIVAAAQKTTQPGNPWIVLHLLMQSELLGQFIESHS